MKSLKWARANQSHKLKAFGKEENLQVDVEVCKSVKVAVVVLTAVSVYVDVMVKRLRRVAVEVVVLISLAVFVLCSVSVSVDVAGPRKEYFCQPGFGSTRHSSEI